MRAPTSITPAAIALIAMAGSGCSLFTSLSDLHRVDDTSDSGALVDEDDAGASNVVVASSGDAGEGSYASTVLADHPVAYFRLDENVGDKSAIDFSGNGRNAQFSPSGVTLGQPGAIVSDSTDHSAMFDTGRAALGNVLDFSGSAAFSIELWINSPVAGDQLRPLSKSDYGGLTGGYSLLEVAAEGKTDGSAGYLLALCNQWRTDEDAGTSACGGFVPFTPGVWNHFVFTFAIDDASRASGYLNGQLVTTSVLHASISNTQALGFGSYDDSAHGGGVFTGSFDEVAFYDRALTAAQVAAHYAASGR